MYLMATANTGMLINALDSPVADRDVTPARAKVIPEIKGRLRLYPNRAPDDVANAVAPPGDSVAARANRNKAVTFSIARADQRRTIRCNQTMRSTFISYAGNQVVRNAEHGRSREP